MWPVANSADPRLRDLLVPATVGIRHFSPAGALAVRHVLETVRPTCILLEAPAGAEELLSLLGDPRTVPPVALLAFSRGPPVHRFTAALASSSPEWAALRHAHDHGIELRGIDLPADILLGLDARHEGDGDGRAPPAAGSSHPGHDEAFARRAGAADFETWWERHLEHLVDPHAYREAAWAFGAGMRALGSGAPDEALLREAFMRRRIREALRDGHAPDRCVVVCGALHAPVLTRDLEPMGDRSLAAQPRLPTRVTLMPYSHARLRAGMDYGAGNAAPAYFGRLHACLERGAPEELGPRFLTEVAQALRAAGHPRSPAEVIDAMALARALATLADSPVVTLGDLRTAAITCLGRGERGPIDEALEAVETGGQVGRVPPSHRRTPLQADLAAELSRLGLQHHRVDRPQLLELDLREDHRHGDARAALRDRERSALLHRLHVSGLPLGERADGPKATRPRWRERWNLRWSPALEIRLAERSLDGDTLEEVATGALLVRLAGAHGARGLAEVLELAVACQLPDLFVRARGGLQAAVARDTGLASVAGAAAALRELLHDVGVRALDPAPLAPLLGQLFLRAVLLMPNALDAEAEPEAAVREALVSLTHTATLAHAHVDASRFDSALARLALGDSGRPLLRGLCCALALERGALAHTALEQLLARRLSPGAGVSEAAAFFEGLTLHNRAALVDRDEVWGSLDAFVAGLEGTDFVRVLVPLRRAFTAFTAAERRRLAGRLRRRWQDSRGPAPEAPSPLDQDEVDALARALEALGELDL